MKEALLVLDEFGSLRRVSLREKKKKGMVFVKVHYFWVVKSSGKSPHYVEHMPEQWFRYATIQALMKRGMVACTRYGWEAKITDHGRFRAKLLRYENANA
jgi:hypothetical protein